jgi:transcription-repair coupling factor (superfamily II helicase)
MAGAALGQQPLRDIGAPTQSGAHRGRGYNGNPFREMPSPLDIVGSVPCVRHLPDLLRAGGQVNIVGAPGSGAALLAAWLAENVRTYVLVVCAGVEEAEEFAEDVDLFVPGLASCFPALEVLPGDVEEPNEAIVGARLSVLRRLAGGGAEQTEAGFRDEVYLSPTAATRVIVASVAAVMQPTRSPEELRRGTRTVELGQAADPAELVQWLAEAGYHSTPQVTLPGEYCLRGGILDVYSHGAVEPVRIEFFGEDVDSIRTFDPSTQLSSGQVRHSRLTAGTEPAPGEDRPAAGLLDYLPADRLAVVVEPDRVWSRARALRDQAGRPSLLVAPETVEAALSARPRVVFGADGMQPTVEVDIRQRDTFGPDLDSMLAELERICAEFDSTVVYCISPAEADRFRSLLRGTDFGATDRLSLQTGRLNHGVLFPAAGLALIPHHRLFGRYRQRRFARHAREGEPIDSAGDLEPGDLVVHVEHGIGRFVGMSVIERDGHKREHVQLEFADRVHVHVPCDRMEVVHRYVGVGGHRPELSKIRGASWRRAKMRAQEAVEDLAGELLELQAIRETQPGIRFPDENEWVRQFESEFPYEETDDQLRAICDVKDDMRAGRPMDRLLCGDVGYGKTEVAMRAAFVAVMGEKQAAVLVPTTVLAQQHFRTFSERMADYPIRVEMLSRFRTGAETREVLGAMASGAVDVVIGTHRLLQKDVEFRDLGLVIIDEEQRFGVEHKEKLKKLRATVDVLTMTATPIPRTLHMAMMGLREISALQTPPHDRQAIQTRVGPSDAQLLRNAILRELNREGQVYVIHNRVQSIDALADRIRQAVPEASVAVVHGQMPERELARNMVLFVDGAVDVLVATTIIENGVDIPNANTIIIDRAELLGLAEMHQLRGRVGRYIHKAYAYFFTPRDRPVTPEVEQRLDTIRRYSQLGAGFDIALRDLEMRGAGNILGPDQSGHIAAVGYSLYCRLLARAAARMRGEPVREPPTVTLDIGLEAFLPEDYVPTPKQRMEVYRRLGRCVAVADLRDVEAMLRDRYGPIPPQAENLVTETEVRILAEAAGIRAIRIEDGRLHLSVRDGSRLEQHFAGARRPPRRVSDDLAVVDSGFPRDDPVMLGAFLRRMLL